MARMTLAATLLALFVGLSACGDDASMREGGGGEEYVYQNPVFTNTSLLSAQAHPGLSQGEPRFSWTATSYRHVVCAVFDERISVSDGNITNPHHIRWIWHSGLSTGREGALLYEQGVSDGETGAAPIPLENGTYYWAVWTLDAQGVPARSTLEYTLQIPMAAE